VAATIKCRIERHDDRIEAFFDSIGQTLPSRDFCGTAALPLNVLQNYFHDQIEQY
jgi:hypothetical protein